jgi:peptidoglycan/LPS O-acetylase OafA/YrhL
MRKIRVCEADGYWRVLRFAARYCKGQTVCRIPNVLSIILAIGMLSVMTLETRSGSGVSANIIHREEVSGLTGLRFVAAFCVLIAHSMTILMSSHEIYWFAQASGFGMTLFFVLSGFVIHYNYARTVTGRKMFAGIAAFLWARFARLYPLFLLMLLLYVLVSNKHLEFWAGRPERLLSVLQALPYFLLSVQSWFYFPIGNSSLVYAVGPTASVTWSISTEWFFYLVYPCLAWVIVSARKPLLTVGLAGLWCALWIEISIGLYDRTPQIDAWAIEHFGSIAGGREHPQDSFVRWLLYFSPYLRIGEFVLGALTAQFYFQLRGRKVSALENSFGTAVFVAAATSVAIITYFSYGSGVSMNIFEKMDMNFALAPSAALLIFCAARYRNTVVRLLNSRPAIVLGDASYSIYLVHLGVLLLVVWLAGSAAHGIVLDSIKLIVVVTAIILISILLYRYYELPARKWLRQRWGKRATSTPAQLPQSSAT